MTSLPLFEAPAAGDWHAAFEHWLEVRRQAGDLRRSSSIQVYRDMWTSFAAWCLGQSPAVTMKSLDTRDLQAFQAARFGMKTADLSLTPRHTLRWMRLIDRVLRHHAAEHDETPNTAAADWIAAHPEIRYAEAAAADPLPEFLSVAEARHLIAFLSTARPRPGLSPARRNAHVGITWQELRNRVAVGLQLGGGLTPGDVRVLTLDSPTSRGGQVRDRPWKLTIPGNGNAGPREAPITPWAGELLQHWLQVRTEAAILGPYLFPSTRSGKQWGKESQYKCARQVLNEAGLDSSDGGSFRLRHTFALRQLRRGTDSSQVARWLGVEPEVMVRYGRVLAYPADVI